jgi:hypothetical protein
LDHATAKASRIAAKAKHDDGLLPAMTLRELREQVTALAQQAEAEREHLADALQSMDYERALACQMTLDRVENELSEVSSRLFLRPDH